MRWGPLRTTVGAALLVCAALFAGSPGPADGRGGGSTVVAGRGGSAAAEETASEPPRAGALAPLLSEATPSHAAGAPAPLAAVPGCVSRPDSYPTLSYVWNIAAPREAYRACPADAPMTPAPDRAAPPVNTNATRWPPPWEPPSPSLTAVPCPFPCILQVSHDGWVAQPSGGRQCYFWLVQADSGPPVCGRTRFALLRTASAPAALDKYRRSNYNAARYASRQGLAFYLRLATERQMGGLDGHFSKVIGLHDVLGLGWHQWTLFTDMDSWFTSFDIPLEPFTHEDAYLVMQDEARLATAAFLLRASDWSLALLQQWLAEGQHPYTRSHPFEQTALIHLLNQRMAGLHGYTYHGSCPTWFGSLKQKRMLLSRLALQMVAEDPFSRKVRFKYNFICNLPERHNLGCLPVPLSSYNWLPVGLSFVPDNGTAAHRQLITCTYTLCSRRPGLIKHTGSAFWKSCEELIPV